MIQDGWALQNNNNDRRDYEADPTRPEKKSIGAATGSISLSRAWALACFFVPRRARDVGCSSSLTPPSREG